MDTTVYQFAVAHSDQPVVLEIELQQQPDAELPTFSLGPQAETAALEMLPAKEAGRLWIRLTVPPAPPDSDDDELVLEIRDESRAGETVCRVVLRRTQCRISAALIEHRAPRVPLRAQTTAALLWHGWRRYRELVGLKRFTSGKSGSDVLVFRPRLRDPSPDGIYATVIPGVISEAWGSPLLVKTGPEYKLREEWARYQLFVTDRAHPFMARSEAYLTVRAPGRQPETPAQATLVGSFLGGELLQAESLEHLVRGSPEVAPCLLALQRLSSIMASWYAGSAVHPLRAWRHVFRFLENGRLHLFGRYDFHEDADRKRYRTPLAWDTAFAKKEHLRDHWLGKQDRRDGLLYRLLNWELRYSLIHGDLHARNVLADPQNVWLLDFGGTEVAPTLFDFCKLEVYLRLWCLVLSARHPSSEDAAMELETHLLDHMTGGEASLEPLRALAPTLGADPQQLLKVADCISFIRREAARYGQGSPDRRDYLAVLFVTVLSALKYAGEDPRLAPNFRLLVGMAWVLEDVLSRMVGMQPFPRDRAAFDAKRMVSRQWLAAPGAPGRVRYLITSPDGRRALEPLAATCGVTQNENHHLDVFDHTLLVLAYVERLLEDPVDGFMDPAGLDQRVTEDLAQQGIQLPEAPCSLGTHSRPDENALADRLDPIRRMLDVWLDEDARMVLKWGALLHDVGKPSARTLRVHPKTGREAVQFLGHGDYGLQLVHEHLAVLFRRPCPQGHSEMELQGADWFCPRCGEKLAVEPGDLVRRVENLILRHHDHHNLVNRYIEHRDRFVQVRQADDRAQLPRREQSFLQPYLDPTASPHAADFPLFILHGFADLLACRGPATTTDFAQVAEIDLVLLGLFAQAQLGDI